MSAGLARLPARTTVLLLLSGPLAVAAGAALVSTSSAYRLTEPGHLAAREAEIQRRVTALVERAAATAAFALEVSPEAAFAGRAGGVLAARLEGVAVLGSDLVLETWEGVPAEPPADFAEPGSSAWRIRIDGARTRLLARAGPDGEGRIGLASFVVDSERGGDLPFRDLLPPALLRGLQIDVRFAGDEAGLFGAGGGAGSAHARLALLTAPDGNVLARAWLEPVARDWLLARLWAAARAWALVLVLVALGVLVRWDALIAGPAWGIGVALAAIAAARAVLFWQDVPARLLPRGLGSPDLYGSTAAWGLAASPADLVLSACAAYLSIAAIRRLSAARARLIRLAVAIACGAAATALAAVVAQSISRNTRLPLLGRPAPFVGDGRLALWVALLLVLLAAAESWGAVLRSRRIAVGATLAVLIAGSCVLLERETRRIDVEHLAHDLVPQVLEQESYRRVALSAALREIAEDERMVDRLAHWRPETSAFDAYEAWVSGELYDARLESSVDIYGPDGEHWSHFGFDLPPLDEAVDAAAPTGEITLREESFQIGIAQEHRLLHGEVAVAVGDEIVAIVVAHVRDERDNLPFLPWSRPYLAALGPVGVPGADEAVAGPAYVLYDEADSVVVTTLREPPAAADVRPGAEERRTLRVALADRSYVGLAVAEGGWLHVLLAPRRSAVEQVATIVRFGLLGALLLVTALAVRRLARRGAARELGLLLRGSFQRKLVAAVLVASVPPLVGLALFLRSYIERRADAELAAAARDYVAAARQVVDDFSAQVAPLESLEGAPEAAPDDVLLHWLRSVVGQEIHVYRDGLLEASSKRELFSSGLLPPRLDGRVWRGLLEQGLPALVLPTRIGSVEVPVAYSTVQREGLGERIVAVLLAVEPTEIAEEAARVAEMILLATVLLGGLLAAAATLLARTVARPVRELVEATGRLAAGDDSLRLAPRGQDELSRLSREFNAMAAALAAQRADLERRRDYIETLLAHATTGVVSLDPAGRIVTLNPAAERLLQAARRRLAVGAELAAALDSVAQLRPLGAAVGAARARAGVPVDVDLAGERQPRRIRLVRVELRGASGDRVGTMILLDDVTDLMRSNQLAAWAEMARAIAHEIKNPLTPIQLSAEHLARLLADRGLPVRPEEQACLGTIMKQVRALYAIAGEFSAYAKLPDLAPEPTDPVAFMREVAGPYRAGRPPGVTIEEAYEPAPPVRIDAKVLARAVVNLIENALQAMERGGTLRLAVHSSDGHVELRVSDTGPGLAPAVRERLFEPYFSTKTSGTGLGLAIARRAVEAHRGEILVDSPPGGGTTFAIRLPAA